MNEASERLLAHAARRAVTRPAFIAHALEAYLDALGGEDQDLAAALDVDVPTVDRLKLCRRPTGAWNQAIVEIAKGLGINASRLANLLNAAEATLALKEGASSEASTLLAARTRDQDDDQT